MQGRGAEQAVDRWSRRVEEQIVVAGGLQAGLDAGERASRFSGAATAHQQHRAARPADRGGMHHRQVKWAEPTAEHGGQRMCALPMWQSRGVGSTLEGRAAVAVDHRQGAAFHFQARGEALVAEAPHEAAGADIGASPGRRQQIDAGGSRIPEVDRQRRGAGAGMR